MAINERWPIDKYGQDLNKAVPNAVQPVGGARVFVPSLNKMPFNDLGLLNIQNVTGSSAIILPTTNLVVIQRSAPVATALTLPDVEDAINALGILDWSTSVATHTITLTPGAGQTIMQQANLQLVSVTGVLAHVVLVPVVEVSGWMIW